jgi:hypothetical protein
MVPTGWRGPLVALALGATIVLVGREVTPRVVVEMNLRKADAQVHVNPTRVLLALAKDALLCEASENQKKRALEIGRAAVRLARGDHPLLREIGWRAFEPGLPAQEYVTSSREMTLVFEIPPGLKATGPVVRVTSAGRTLCGAETSADGAVARADVKLRDNESLAVDIDFAVAIGGAGAVTEPIARGVRLVQSTRGPLLRLRAGDALHELRDDGTLALKIPIGTPLAVEVSDDRGLAGVQWAVDGITHEPVKWPDAVGAATRVASLPADLVARAANSRTIDLRATNSNRLMTRASVTIRVRDPGVPMIGGARVGDQRLLDGGAIDVSERSLKLLLTVATGEDASGLRVAWDDQPLHTHVDGQDVFAVLDSAVEGVRALEVSANGVPVLRARIRFDWSAPEVAAVLDPGRFARDLEVKRPAHEVPVGAIVSTTIADEIGLDRMSIEWAPEGPALEALDDPEPESREGETLRAWTRRVRCSMPGEGRIRISGADRAGNRTTIHEFRLRVADPMADRVVTVNGWPFPGTKPIATPEPRLVVTSEGGIDLDGMAFVLLDPSRGSGLVGRSVLGRTERPRMLTATVDIDRTVPSGATLIGVLSRNDQELARGSFIVDYSRPRFQVTQLTRSGGTDDEPRYLAEPGQRVAVLLTDDVEVDAGTIGVIQGATIEEVTGTREISVWLVLKEVFEEAIVLRAADVAGNVAELRFEVVAPGSAQPDEGSETTPTSRQVAPKAAPDGGPPAPDPPATLDDVRGAPRVTHPALGTFHLVGTESLGAPFYLAEHELLVKEWRIFVAQLSGRSNDALAKAAASLLNYNTERLQNGEDEPLAGTTIELVRAYVRWANDIAPDYGIWRVPTVAQWQFAAGRGLHPQAVYPTTAGHTSGNDLANLGTGGALFGRAFLTAREMPKQSLQPGAFGLRAMPGSLYEWVIDGSGAQQRLRLVGGSAFSPKEACRLDSAPKSQQGVEDYERGLRLALLPRRR